MDNYDKAEDFFHIMGKLNDLMDDYCNLRYLIDDMPNIHMEDREDLRCIACELTGFSHFFSACVDLLMLLFNMENEKDQFNVQSATHNQFQRLRRNIDDLINTADTWKMDNFRCQNFMRQMKKTFVEIKYTVDAIDFV